MNNPPAFPTEKTIGLNKDGTWIAEIPNQNGMTLKDYFAAKALQGICASGPDPSWTNARLAAEAYALANAMLKAREA